MRKTFTICVITALFIGCGYSSQERIYKELAIKYLQTTVHNPESIDTVKWGKPDTSYAPSYFEIYNLQKLYADTLELERNYYAHKANQTSDKDSIKRYLKVSRFYKTQDSILLNVMKNNPKTKTKETYDWKVNLIYRAKDKSGIVRLDTCTFTFDKYFREVIDADGINL